LSAVDLEAAGVPRQVLSDPRYVKRAAPLQGIEEYDTELFGLRPDEAAYMDPQQYHLLECVYEAMETACCSPHDKRRRVGIFAGGDQSYFALRRISDDVLWDPIGHWDRVLTNDNHFLATWIAYRLGFSGPAVGLQTACSTSLVTVHFAMHALLAGDCDVAIAGGVSIRGPQTRGYLHRDGGILSPTGTCRPFDRSADGTVLSSGVGVVVLQRLEEALAGGFPIWAVLKGSAVNNDGDLRLAYSAPSEHGQAAVVLDAMRVGQVDPRTIGYVEAHGTATQLGDVVEHRGLVSAFTTSRPVDVRCRLGSVKANVGHLEAAAGMAGLIKAVLSVKCGEIYPTPGFEHPNPLIDFDGGPFAVAVQLEPFERLHGPRRAGVSSFGIGGTNCHVVIEEPPLSAISSHKCRPTWHVLGISAATPRALRSHMDQVTSAVAQLPAHDVADACYSLLVGREGKRLRVARTIADSCHGVAGTRTVTAEWDCTGSSEQREGSVVLCLPSSQLNSAAVLNQLLDHPGSRVTRECPGILEKLRMIEPNDPQRQFAETLLACFEIAFWLVDRGVRPTEIVGPAHDSLNAVIRRGASLAATLHKCLACPPIDYVSPAKENIRAEAQLRIDLLASTRKLHGGHAGRSVSGVVADSADPAELQLTRCLAELWVRGIPVNWHAVFGARRRLGDLPTYPFDRRSLWRPPTDAPRLSNLSVDLGAPDDPQGVLSRLWRGLLGSEPEPADRFLDCGGDSLLAVQLAARISESLGAHVGARAVLESSSFDALLQIVREVLVKQPSKEYLLSPAQEAVWFMQKAGGVDPAYNVQAAFRIRGDLRVQALREAFDHLLGRQNALRTVFFERDGHPRQRVAPQEPFQRWRVVEHVSDAAVSGMLSEHGRTSLNLGAPPLLSVLLLKLHDSDFVLSVVSHHIVSDEWSAQLMIQEVLELYEALTAGRLARLTPLTADFAQQAERLRQQLVSANAYDRLTYWRAALAGVPALEFPCDRTRPVERAFRGATRPFHVPALAQDRLHALARDNRTTPFGVFAAAFFALIHRYTGQDDICIGTNVAGREETQSEDLVGLFTNTVPLRTVVDPDAPFTALLSKVHATILEAQEEQLPLSTLAAHLSPQRVAGRNPFFDVTLVLQNVPRPRVNPSGLSIEPMPVHNGTCKFDLELCVHEAPDGALLGHWEYDCDLFDPETIDALDVLFRNVLCAVVEAPDGIVSRIPLLSEEARTLLVLEARGPALDFPRDGCWDLFRQQADQAPTKLAVVGIRGERWTYQELHRRAIDLAARLAAVGAGPGALCALFCDRTERYIQALLAVEVCRAAFVPLDPSLPDVRLAEMIKASAASVVVLEGSHLRRFAENIEPLVWQPLGRIVIDAPEARPATTDPTRYSPALAYVIYTSGSTGSPKGVMVSKAGMRNHLWSKVRTLGLDSTSVVAQTAPICFDISVWQICAPLITGGTVVLVAETDVLDIHSLIAIASERGVTILEVVPSYLELLISAMEHSGARISSLQYLIATGETLPTKTCRRWLELNPGVPLINAYGPTECSDDVAQHIVSTPPTCDAERVPIGRPLPNMAIHILDRNLQVVPAGAWGEICITGVCVGLGYLHDLERSAEVFVPDPFTSVPGALMYRSGDIGRRRVDGTLEHWGRRDGQVKVRGVRVEVEEVESALRACPAVEQIAVTLDQQSDALIALVQLRAAMDIDAGLRELRQFAAGTLPGCMIPSVITPVRALPRHPSGKLDRAGLCAMACVARRGDTFGGPHPVDDTLVPLRRIWSEVLNISDIPYDADFFNLGGDSLRAMRVASLAQRKGFQISARDIVVARTLGAIATRCRQVQGLQSVD